MDKTLVSKYLSLILRHNPSAANVELDANGWTDIDKLIIGMNMNGVQIDRNLLLDIVANSDKQRFALSDDLSKIRANQGHSVGTVNISYAEVFSPDILYHGTASQFLNAILQNGLISKERQYVHLSKDIETAKKVGKRHGNPVILEINAAKMYQDKLSIYISENNVFLTKYVPIEYIKQIDNTQK